MKKPLTFEVIEKPLGSQHGYVNGNRFVRHRLDGPALTEFRGNGSIIHEIWYIHGKIHNAYGPAKITYLMSGKKKNYYFLNGRDYSIRNTLKQWEIDRVKWLAKENNLELFE